MRKLTLMTASHNFDLYEQLEDLQDLPAIRNVSKRKLRYGQENKNRKPTHLPDEFAGLAEQENELNFSYHASKHEGQWLIDSLADLYRQQWFDDILRLIKGGGKEASVYQCLGNNTTRTEFIAAKVYRPRRFRQLRNDALYREGRQQLDDEGHEIRDDRALHAIQKRTRYGRQLMHTSWIEHEFQTMIRLFEAGADIPQPYASGYNTILMDYIGWEDLPAPTLNTIPLQQGEARGIFDRLIYNVEIMLANQRVHGDLSAFNILYFEGDVYLIDFPQAIHPHHNRNAYAIFQRDIQRLCEYFQSQGVRCRPKQLAESLWLKHGYDIKPAVDPSLLEPEVIDEGF
jgi:RIO kinase 1